MAQEVTQEHIQEISRILKDITPNEQRDMHALESELSVLLAHRELTRKLSRALLEQRTQDALSLITELKQSTLANFGRALAGKTEDPALEARFAELESKLQSMSHVSFFNAQEIDEMAALGLESDLAKQARAQAQKMQWGDIAILLRRLRAEWSHLQQEKQHLLIHEHQLLDLIANGVPAATKTQLEQWATQLEMNRLALEQLLRDQKAVLESFGAFLKEQRTMQSVIDRLAEQDVISLNQIKHTIATFRTPAEYSAFMGKILRMEKKFKKDEQNAIREFLSKASGQAAIRSELQEQLSKYRAETDILTQLPNRGVFNQRLDNELARVQRYGGTFSTLILDADHFKSINDVFGHDAGDRALVMIAKTCQRALRDTDLIARWGGEEFVALLPNTDKAGAVKAANGLREEVRNASKPLMTALNAELKTAKGITTSRAEITLSIGVAVCPDDGRVAEELMAKKDQALYAAKDSGRDAVGYFDGGTIKISREKRSFSRRLLNAARWLVGRAT